MRSRKEASPRPDHGISGETGSIKLEPSLLSDISALVERCTGLHFSAKRHRDLERKVCEAARESGYQDAVSYARTLLVSPLSQKLIEALARRLAVGETYFFRDMGVFDALGEQALVELIRQRRADRRLKIWSAGCSTGEEAYSIAILLDRMIPDLSQWEITILATDINQEALDRAAEGVYRDWSFRDAPGWVKDQYFTKTDGGFELLGRIRKMVTFCRHNLAIDPYPASFNGTDAINLIFCRNVLMYFSRERALEIVRRFSTCLTDEAWLVTSPVESGLAKQSLFEAVRFQNATLYRKRRAAVLDEGSRARRAVPPGETEKSIEKDSIGRAAQMSESATGQKKERQKVHSAVASRKASPGGPTIRESLSAAALAKAAADQGELSRALELCEKAIDADKLNPSLHYLHATILQETGKIGEAAASIRRAIYADQDFVLAHFALGHLMHRQGKHKEAEKHFTNACSLLEKYGEEEILPESEGISAGTLREIIMEYTTYD